MSPLNIGNLSLSSFRYLALISLWLLIWWAAMLMEYQPYISLWYPPAGLSLAAFILIGRRAFLPILAATLVAGFWMYLQEQSSLPWLSQAQNSLILGTAHAVAYALGGFYFRRLVGSWDIQHIPQRILFFLVVIFHDLARRLAGADCFLLNRRHVVERRIQQLADLVDRRPGWSSGAYPVFHVVT